MPKIDDPDGTGDVVVRPFADFLAQHNNGQAAAKAGEQLHELIAAVRDTGKKGTLTIKVGLSSMDEETLVATVEVACSPPKHPEKSAVYFATADGNLSVENPRQLKFETLKEVAAPAAARSALAVSSSDDDDRRDERAVRDGLA